MIIGDLMLDEYLIGKVARISPEAPVPVIEVNKQDIRLGGAANVANNILSLGCIPVLVGIIGNDRMGDIFKNLLREKNIYPDGLVCIENRPTTVKTRIIGESQHIARVDHESKEYIDFENENLVLQKINEILPTVDGIIFEDYNKGVLTKTIIETTINLARKQNKLITVDPKFKNFLEYKNATVFKPNIKETEEALAVSILRNEELEKAGAILMEKLKPECLLITKGSNGMTLFEKESKITHVSTKARKVADVSGAGDTVISVLTAAIAGGANFQEAATLANYAAGIVCEEVGIFPIDKDKLYKVCIGKNSE